AAGSRPVLVACAQAVGDALLRLRRIDDLVTLSLGRRVGVGGPDGVVVGVVEDEVAVVLHLQAAAGSGVGGVGGPDGGAVGVVDDEVAVGLHLDASAGGFAVGVAGPEGVALVLAFVEHEVAVALEDG